MGARSAWRISAVTLLFALSAICFGPAPIQGREADEGAALGLPAHVAGEVLVKFKHGTHGAVKAGVVAGVGKVARDYAQHQKTAHGKEFFDTLMLVALDETFDVAAAVEALKKNPNVEYAEPNYIVTADNTPNDPSFGSLYAAHNTGQTGGTPDADMDLPEAWDITTGSSTVIVAVIDSGVDYNHEDLAANMWTNPDEIAANGVDDDGNGLIDDIRGWDWVNNDNNPMDDNSHGTHVSGTIAAVGNNTVGVTGVAWSAKIMPLKFLNAAGNGSSANAVLAVQYATQKGAKIMNNSWGGGAYLQSLQDAITAANNAGVMFIASAGNDNTGTPQYPANYAGAICVASTDHSDIKSSFSNYGTWVDVAAPGSLIYSTTPGNTYGAKSGTSMSTPNVVGVCALLLGYGIPKATAETLLINGTDNIDALNPGYEGLLGSGRVNAHTSLLGYSDTLPPSAIADLAGSGLSGSQIRLTATTPTDNLKVAGYKVEQSADGVNFAEVAGSFRALPITVGGLNVLTTYYFRVRAYDVPGNLGDYSNTATASTTANGTPNIPAAPTGKLDPQVGWSWTYSASTTDPDANQVKYTFDWGDGQTTTTGFYNSGATGSTAHSWATPGTYNIRVKATDTQGAVSDWSPALVVTAVANVPPTTPTTLTGPAGLIVNQSGSFVTGGSTEAVGSIVYTFDWGDGQTTSSSYQNSGSSFTAGHTWTTAGTYDVRSKAQDQQGLASAWTTPLTVTVFASNSAPNTPAISSGLTIVGTNASYPYTCSATDPEGMQVQITFDWGDGQTTTSALVNSGADVTASHSWSATGAYNVAVMATDSLGATSAWSTPLVVTVGTNHPPSTPSDIRPFPIGATTVAAGGSVYFDVYVNDIDGDQRKARFDWGDSTTTDTAFSTNAVRPGAEKIWSSAGVYQVRVKGIDTAGAESLWSTPLTVTVLDDATPPGAFTLSATATSGTQISLNWTSPSDDVGLENSTVHRSTDGVNFTQILSRYTTANSAQTFGDSTLSPNTTYYHKVVAIDFTGKTSTSNVTMTTTLTVGNPPATPSTPSGATSGSPGTSYTYTTSATDPDGDQIKYTFDWGDGQTTTTGLYASGATGSSSHSWSAAGTYLVKVKATDANNNVSAWSTTLTVTIAAAQPDLITNSVTFTATSVRRGRNFSVTSAVKNQGAATAGASTIAFRLSANTVWGDADDIIVTATRSVGSLAAGATSSGNTTITVPSSTPLGYYYVLGYADSQGVVIESVETNNSKSSTNRIQVKS